MKFLSKVFFLLAVLTFQVSYLVSAGDYISDAAQALQHSTVYVAPGTPGTDFDTASKLQSMLRSDDNVVLVMFPADALSGTDIFTIVTTLSEKLGNKRTIGLAVGDEVIGYSPLLPSGIAADQMHRADSVSNDPVTALATFTRNIHQWLAAHPLPTPTPTPIQLPKASEISWPVWAVLVGVFVFAFTMLFLRAKKMVKQIKRPYILKSTELLIQELQGEVAKIGDNRLQGDLQNACLIALGLLENLRRTERPQGYVEEKFPGLVSNMSRQVDAILGHESGRHPLPQKTLAKLKEVLFNYDDLFAKLQSDNPESTELVASILDSNNAMISTLGYLPDDNKSKK